MRGTEHPTECTNELQYPAGRKLRFDAIRELRWHSRALPPELRTQMSPLEQQYFKSYDKLLTKYMSKGEDGVGMDLTLVRPQVSAWPEPWSV